jgi:beta-galactosidase
MPFQVQAWKDWRDIVQKNDPTRPWISADGEDDGDGILPATVGHYGDKKTMNRWIAIGKPWGVGEHSMAYYGTPEQVSKYNGDEAYESQWGRMKGLAIECYDLIAQQRANGASYISVFNMAWYALKPLPIGKKDLTTAPSLTEDGVYFTAYQEGVPGIQPERMGPYSTTFNPGYDPSLPLYDSWPMFDAMRAANATGQPGASPYANKPDNAAPEAVNIPTKVYKEVIFVGQKDSKLKQGMDAQGVQFVTQIKSPRQLLYLVDGAYLLTDTEKKSILKNSAQGADVWIWGISPQTVDAYNQILPLPLRMEKRAASSFIPEQKSWMAGLRNADFYFCEIQRNNVSEYGLAGPLVTEGSILLNACNTDWRKWNKRPEEIKTAGVYRSEKEATGAAPVFVKYTGSASSFYVSTLTEFTNSEKGYNTLSKILKQAGIPCVKPEITIADVFFLRDASLQFPENIQEKFQPAGDEYLLDFWVWSPRPLDDLLIEPNMPKLSLFVNAKRIALLLNDKALTATQITTNNSTYKELPLLQAWNKITLRIGLKDKERFAAYFKCDNSAGFLSQLKISLNNEQ